MPGIAAEQRIWILSDLLLRHCGYELVIYQICMLRSLHELFDEYSDFLR